MEGRYTLRSRYGDNGGSVKSRVLAKEDSSRIAGKSNGKKPHQTPDPRAFRNAEGVKSRMSKFNPGVTSSPASKGGSIRLGRNAGMTTQRKEIQPRLDTERSNSGSATRSDLSKRHEGGFDDINNNQLMKSSPSNGSKYFNEKTSFKSVSNSDGTKHIETKVVKKEMSDNDTKLSVVETSVETTVDGEIESDESGIDSMTSSQSVPESAKIPSVDKDTSKSVPQGGNEESDSIDQPTDQESRDPRPDRTTFQKILEDNSTCDVTNEELNGDVMNNDDVTSLIKEGNDDLVSAFASKSMRDRDLRNSYPLRTPVDKQSEEKAITSTSDESARRKHQHHHSNSGLTGDDGGKEIVENDVVIADKDVSEENNTNNNLSLAKLNRGNNTTDASATSRRRRRVRNSGDSSRSSNSCSLASTPDGDVKSLSLESPKIENSSIASTLASSTDLCLSVTSQLSTGDPVRAPVNDTKELPTEPEKASHVTDDKAHDKVIKKKKDFADVTDEVRTDNKTKAKEEPDIKAESLSTSIDNNSLVTSTRTKYQSSETAKEAETTDNSGETAENQPEVKATQEEKTFEVDIQVIANDNPLSTMRYTLDNLEQCTEEAILQKLLEEADQYEDRKKIRAALRVLRKAQADGTVITPKQTSNTKWKAQTTTTVTTKNNSRAIKTTTIAKTEYKETNTPSSKWQSRVKSPQDVNKAPTDPKSLAVKYGLTSQSKRDMTSGPKKVGSIFDREEETPKKSSGRLDVERRQAERRKEITRNRSMPASSSKDARKMFVAKLEGEGGGTKGNKKVGKSPSFVVPNAKNIKQMLLKWCQAKTRGYNHVDINNYSSSWANGMAFCALVHNFFPDAFDYSKLDPKNRAENFDLAFKMAENHGEIPPLLDVEDMVKMEEPDWKCVYTYITEFYKRIRDLGF